MTDELHADDVPIDTGPLKWSTEKVSRARVVATIALAVTMTAVTVMLIAYGSSGWA